MICLDISVNGSPFCRAGIERSIFLSPVLRIFVGSDDCASLSITGMRELPKDSSAHVYWPERNLSPGDVVRFMMIDAADPISPSEIKATDSAQYLEEQRQFEEFERTFVPSAAPAERRWPTLGFRCLLNGEERAVAVMAPHEEHMTCLIDWNRYQPDRSRVSVRSFGRSTQSGGRDDPRPGPSRGERQLHGSRRNQRQRWARGHRQSPHRPRIFELKVGSGQPRQAGVRMGLSRERPSFTAATAAFVSA